jgi:DNA polymerase-4
VSSGTVLHLNLVGLMAAVEERLEPALRGRPFVLAHRERPRAVVLDLSPEAHHGGLRRGMSLDHAGRILPGLVVKPPRPELYARADATFFRLASELSPLVERAGSGHLFVDFRGTAGLWGGPEDGASRLRRRILEDTGLLPSLALASTKTAAKVAARVMRPTGFIALAPGEERRLIRMQPVELLPGVGPLLFERLRLLELEDIGALADLDELSARALGPRGPSLRDRAAGLEASAVDPEPPERRHICASRVLEPDSADPEFLTRRLRGLAAELGFAMRREGLGARRLELRLGFADGLSASASSRCPRALLRDDELDLALGPLLARARSRRTRVRSIALELGEFAPAGPELDLFTPEEAKRGRLQDALDRVRLRYGVASITRASSALGARSMLTGSPGLAGRTKFAGPVALTERTALAARTSHSGPELLAGRESFAGRADIAERAAPVPLSLRSP